MKMKNNIYKLLTQDSDKIQENIKEFKSLFPETEIGYNYQDIGKRRAYDLIPIEMGETQYMPISEKLSYLKNQDLPYDQVLIQVNKKEALPVFLMPNSQEAVKNNATQLSELEQIMIKSNQETTQQHRYSA